MSWMRSRTALLLASVVFPPAGLVLLWLRGSGRAAKAWGTPAILALGVAELFQVYGLRYELNGDTMRPFFSFKSLEAREQDVERDRARQKALPPPPPVAASAPAAVVHAAARPAPNPSPAQPAPVQSAPAPPETPRDYWTDFRGPNRLGIYDEMPILTRWPATGLTRLWKQPIGGGYGGFVAAGGLAFTLEQRRDQETVAAYDIATGREMWTNAWKARFSESMGGDGPRSTPVFDGGRLYVQGAEGELRVIEAATGRTLWNKNILTDNGAQNLTWAQAASPLVVDGKVIVLPGGSGGKSVVAYDKMTGDRIWSAHDDEQAYASPIVVTLAGMRQLVVVSAVRVMGLTLDDGRLLWEFPWETQYHINATHPIVVAPNRFFISSEYGHGAAVVELSPQDDRFAAKVVWQNTKMKNKFNDSVLYQGHIYGLDGGILACIDPRTGEQKWKGGRYGFGQVLLAGGHLVILSERGELALVKADPAAHKELARFDAISGKTWNNPAIAGGVLLVRNAEEMAAFRIGRP